MIQPSAEGRRRAAGFDLSGAGGERVSAPGGFEGRSARNLAVHAVPRRAVRSRADLLDGRAQRSGKGHARRGASLARSVWHVRRLVSGDGGIQFRAAATWREAIERTGYADFWELQKAQRTTAEKPQNYVPIIIALALVAKDSGALRRAGGTGETAANRNDKLEHPADLHLVADATGADLDDLRLLNPQLLRTVTPNDPNFELKIAGRDYG